MRPFLLEEPNQFRAEPPPALTSEQYAKDLNETEAYGALNSTVRTAEQKAIAFFWVGNNINQYNQTMQSVVSQHGMDLVDAAHLLAMGELVTTDAGIACFDSKFFYQFWRPITAIRNADKDGNPDTTADPAWQALLRSAGPPRIPVSARLLHRRLQRHARGRAADQPHRRHHAGRTERQQRPHDQPTLRQRRGHPETGRRRAGLARLPLPQLRRAGRESSATRSPNGSSSATSSPSGSSRSWTQSEWPARRATHVPGSCGEPGQPPGTNRITARIGLGDRAADGMVVSRGLL